MKQSEYISTILQRWDDFTTIPWKSNIKLKQDGEAVTKIFDYILSSRLCLILWIKKKYK